MLQLICTSIYMEGLEFEEKLGKSLLNSHCNKIKLPIGNISSDCILYIIYFMFIYKSFFFIIVLQKKICICLSIIVHNTDMIHFFRVLQQILTNKRLKYS